MIKNLIIKIICKIVDFLGLKNIILFESVPAYADNTKEVFDELVKRGINKKYKLVWVCANDDEVRLLKSKLSNVYNFKALSRTSKTYWMYYNRVAKVFIVSNNLLYKQKEEQKYIFLGHGCAYKNVRGKFSLPENCVNDCVAISLSEFMAPYDALDFNFDINCAIITGYPRNDNLFNNTVDLHKYFSGDFEKIIYWLPTYRQHKDASSIVTSSISLPIIHDKEIMQRINNFAKKMKVKLIVKIHFAQDMSKIDDTSLSNILFIDNNFLESKGILNYELLGSSDALLSDYSSVIFDYLLCDKPIGVCWEDFDEFSQREGFVLDPQQMMSGCEKIYTADDLCNFIEKVSLGPDELKNKRAEIKNLIHKYQDNQSSKRIVDYLEENIL